MSKEVLTAVKSLAGDVANVSKQFGEVSGRIDKVEKALSAPDFNRGRLAAEPIDHKLAKQGGFQTPREYLAAVLQATVSNRVDPRLKSLTVKKAVGSDEASGVQDAYGGYLLPIGFSPEILKLDPEEDVIGALTRKVPMDKAIIKIPARVDKNHTTSVAGGLRFYRREDTTETSSSRTEYEQISLEAHNLMGISFATEELLYDSPTSFATLVADGFKDQLTYHLINERINGTGIGEYLGVMRSPALVTVAKETGQAADTITYQNVVKMRSRCWGYKDAVWLANHDTMPQLMSIAHPSASGSYIPAWQPSARDDHPDMFFGRPIYFTEYTATLGDAGDMLCVNWREYLEGTYQPMQTAESIHVRFVNHERAFKFWTRNAGMPWWRSALTPKNSTTTLSPYVALGAR